MFEIDCISLTKDVFIEKYIERFTQLGYCVKRNNSFHHLKESTKIDGVIIFEQNLNGVGEVCKYLIELKKISDALIWIVIPKEESSAKLIYLQMGADAVFTYESTEENIMTMTNALNRYKRLREYQKPTNQSTLRLDSTNLSVIVDGTQEVPLTRIEYKIMEFLLKNPNIAISYQDIYQKVWTGESQQSKLRVSNVIFHLRKKLDEDSGEPRFIKTIRSKGYLIKL